MGHLTSFDLAQKRSSKQRKAEKAKALKAKIAEINEQIKTATSDQVVDLIQQSNILLRKLKVCTGNPEIVCSIGIETNRTR